MNALFRSVEAAEPSAISGVKDSNGTTAVSIVAAVTNKRIVPTTLMVYNGSTSTDHVVKILSATTVILEFYLAAKGSFILDGRGDVATVPGEALQFKLGEAGTDVHVTGFYVQK